MKRPFLIFSLLFFITIQSIPGSMQAFADHVIEPTLIETGLVDADHDSDVICCQDNNFQEASMCKSDCRLVLSSAFPLPQAAKKSFDVFQMTEPTRSHSPPSFRPPIS